MTDIERLNRIDKEIQRIATEFGLDYFPQKFDLIPSDKMLEFMAYGFPNNFAWWGFGRDYEILRKQFENAAASVPLEVVFNLNPSRAYVIKDMPIALQILTMAHVYGHNNFMKNNRFFSKTNRGILSAASFARERFLNYERRYGIEDVEKTIDAGKAIEINVNPDLEQDTECEEEKRIRMLKELSEGFTGLKKRPAVKSYAERQKELEKIRDDITKKSPIEPEQDILFYLIDKAPLEEWQRDVLSVIWEQSRYHMPQRRTKIMNEGWASLWHVLIMERLHDEKLITNEEFDTFNVWSSRILTTSYLPYSFNPYTLGVETWRDIKERWDKGRFGRDFDECVDANEKTCWDKKLGLGNKKLFEVRDAYSDMNFLEEFLTKDLIDKIQLWFYQPVLDKNGNVVRDKEGRVILEVASRDWVRIKKLLRLNMVNFGFPYITIEDGKYQDGWLYLKHHWEGIGLDKEYREATIAHIYYFWKKPVCIETVEVIMSEYYPSQLASIDRVVYTFDGNNHERRKIGEIDKKEHEQIIKNSPFFYLSAMNIESHFLN